MALCRYVTAANQFFLINDPEVEVDHVGDVGTAHWAILAPRDQGIEDSPAFRTGERLKEIREVFLCFTHVDFGAVLIVPTHATTVWALAGSSLWDPQWCDADRNYPTNRFDGTGDHITAEGSDYATARAALAALVPEGQQLIAIRADGQG